MDVEELTSLTIVLAEMLEEQSTEVASKCGFPPHLLAGALVFAAVKAAIVLHHPKELTEETLKKGFSDAIENAFLLYTQPTDHYRNKSLH